MTHSYGKRSGTRYKYAKGFKKHGMPNNTRYLTTFRRGDYVTIKVDGSIQKGMPTTYYHGTTGEVFDVNKNSVGVRIFKRVGNRQILKLLHVRREHVFKSKSIDEFNRRRAENDKIARQNAGTDKKIDYKRKIAGPEGPVEAFGEIKFFTPIPFVENF